MKANWSLRNFMFLLAVVVLILPLLLLAGITQSRMWNLVRRDLNKDQRWELDTADRVTTMVMDKYDSVLQDFSTDEEVTELLRQIGDGGQEQEDAHLGRELRHLCRADKRIQDITLVLEDGTVYFCDQDMLGFIKDHWPKAEMPAQWEKQYEDGGLVQMGGSSVYLFQIVHRILDLDENPVGTVMMRIDQRALWDMIPEKAASKLYICEDGVIIAAQEESTIGDRIESVETRGHWVLSQVNQTTGWGLYDYYSTKEYDSAIGEQWWVVTTATIGIILLGITVMYLLIRPMLDQVSDMVEKMGRVEQGDCSVRLTCPKHGLRELWVIVEGFNHMVEKIGLLMDQIRSAAQEQKNAELSVMESQIDPHFLYNTLDTINWKAIEREEYEISGMVCALADILRYSIREPGGTVTVGQELYWLSQYILLQRAKLEYPLDVVTDVPEELKGFRIHKLLLQPFVENAIKHGMYQKEGAGRLEIRGRLIDEQLYIAIRDNGSGIPNEILRVLNDPEGQLKGHVGIANVKKRLKLYYGDGAEIFFESKEGVGTTVHVFIRVIEKGKEGKREDSSG